MSDQFYCELEVEDFVEISLIGGQPFLDVTVVNMDSDGVSSEFGVYLSKENAKALAHKILEIVEE